MGLDAIVYGTQYTDGQGDIQFKDEIAYLNLSHHLELFPLIKELALRECDEYTGCETYEFNTLGVVHMKENFYTGNNKEVNEFLDKIIEYSKDIVFIKVI